MTQADQVSNAYAQAKKATLAQVRALKIGDIIKAFYKDTEEPQYRMITTQWCASNGGGHHMVESVGLDAFGHRSNHARGPGTLNTDKWVFVTHAAGVLEVLNAHVMHQEVRADLETLNTKTVAAPVEAEQPLTYAPGDEVRFVKSGETAFILEAHLRDWGGVEYATTTGAWYPTADFVLVRRASVQTLAQGALALKAEADEDLGDEDDAEDDGL